MTFQLNSWNVEWVITALQTTTPKHRYLRQITIEFSYYLTLVDVGHGNNREAVGEASLRWWLDLDRLLVQLWESRSIHLTVVFTEAGDMRDCIGHLLPEITKKGIIDLVEHTLW